MEDVPLTSSGGGSLHHPPSSLCPSGPRGCAHQPLRLLPARSADSGPPSSRPVRYPPSRRDRSGLCRQEGKDHWVAEEVRVRNKSLPYPRVQAIRSLHFRSVERV